MVANTGVRSKKSKVIGAPSKMDHREFQKLEQKRRIQLIQELIPIGLMAVSEELQKEVAGLFETEKEEPTGLKKHGTNPGTVRLGDRILPIRVPRLRNDEGEVSLEAYRLLHGHPELDSDSVFRKVTKGVSSRNIEDTLQPATGGIGASKSSISRKTTVETKKRLAELTKRPLDSFQMSVLFIDGTSFAKDQMIIALGVDLDGHKKVLGFTQSSTEASAPIKELLLSLLSRGLVVPEAFLACIDGSKGIRKAVKDVFQAREESKMFLKNAFRMPLTNPPMKRPWQQFQS